MICVLEILEGPATGKRICVFQNQCFEIGRMSTADFSITSDGHMSRRHLLIDTTQQAFRIRDIGSSNGTFVNGARIEVQTLGHGDLIRAGQSVFSVSIVEDGANPHQVDGTRFQKLSEAASRGTLRTIQFDEDGEPSNAVDQGPGSGNGDELTVLESPRVEGIAKVSGIGSALSEGKLREPWQEYFSGPLHPSIWLLRTDIDFPEGRYLGICKLLAYQRRTTFVVNKSQRPSDEKKILQQLEESGGVQLLTSSLILLTNRPMESLTDTISYFLGKDAVVGLFHDNPLQAVDLSKLANSFSYPSLLARHLITPESPCRDYFFSQNISALYESDRSGGISLFRP